MMHARAPCQKAKIMCAAGLMDRERLGGADSPDGEAAGRRFGSRAAVPGHAPPARPPDLRAGQASRPLAQEISSRAALERATNVSRIARTTMFTL